MKKDLELKRIQRRDAIIRALGIIVTMSVIVGTYSVLASANVVDLNFTGKEGKGSGGDEATNAIKNFGRIMKTLVTVVGVIMALWGVVQLGLSISAHDQTQRMNGLLALAGGILIAIAPALLKEIANVDVDGAFSFISPVVISEKFMPGMFPLIR